MTDPLEGWARRVATLPAALVEATPAAVRTAAETLEGPARANLLTTSGGDGRLSRVRSGKGARVDVSVKVEGAGSSARGLVVPVGPVQLLEKDTRRHREPFEYGTGRRYAMAGQTLAGGGTARRKRAGRTGVVVVPGYGPRRGVNHPGTRGKHPIGKAFTAAGPRAGLDGVAVFAKTARRHMGGSS